MRDLGKALAQLSSERPVQILYGTATALNTVPVAGVDTAVELPALMPVSTGQYCAVLVAGADMLILGPVTSDGVLRIAANGDVDVGNQTDGVVRIGPLADAQYLALDANEIQALSDLNGVASASNLLLQAGGGDILIGPSNGVGTQIFVRGTFSDWIDVTSFSNSWENYSATTWEPAGYRRIGDIVQLRGLVKNGSPLDGTISTLPTGYRPPYHIILPATAYGGAGVASPAQLRIYNTGAVFFEAGANAIWSSLGGITFSTQA